MRSIQRYLLGWIIGALGAAALVIGGVAYLVTLDEMNEIFDADLRHVAESLGSYLHADSAAVVAAEKGLPKRDDVPSPEEIVTILWTADGRRVYSSDPRVAIPFMGTEALTRITIGREDWIVYTDVSVNGVAQAAQRALARRETAAESASKIVPAMLGVALAVAALLLFALRRGLRPLDLAARDIAARTARTLTPLHAAELPAELMPLVQALNGLMGRLSEALDTQRRFLGDAAHELRTPVTALRLQLQLLQRATDEASRQAATRELAAGIARSQRLIEKLLHVARAEPDAQARHTGAVDLARLVREVVGAASVQAEALGIDLGADATEAVVVDGDAGDLEVLLTNLVENALRYTPAGGVVDVAACRLDDRPALRVVDSGPGIPEEDRDRVFDRFYRGADAPLQAREPGGSGLGLAIVRGIAERHGAVVTLHAPTPGRGLEVRVVFPPAAG